mmetsp:Transcript_36060/g.84399  ORF Transcript_36060/g.84399 Transcript_36060/m.84399 type:complete len:320 (-) Transcript_36060:1369-2328(-)
MYPPRTGCSSATPRPACMSHPRTGCTCRRRGPCTPRCTRTGRWRCCQRASASWRGTSRTKPRPSRPWSRGTCPPRTGCTTRSRQPSCSSPPSRRRTARRWGPCTLRCTGSLSSGSRPQMWWPSCCRMRGKCLSSHPRRRCTCRRGTACKHCCRGQSCSSRQRTGCTCCPPIQCTPRCTGTRSAWPPPPRCLCLRGTLCSRGSTRAQRRRCWQRTRRTPPTQKPSCTSLRGTPCTRSRRRQCSQRCRRTTWPLPPRQRTWPRLSRMRGTWTLPSPPPSSSRCSCRTFCTPTALQRPCTCPPRRPCTTPGSQCSPRCTGSR